MKQRRKRTRPQGRATWQSLLTRQRTSGLSIAAFCRKEGVSEGTFYQWQARLRAEPAFRRPRPKGLRRSNGGVSGSSFVEVTPAVPSSTATLEVLCGPAPVIRLTGPVDRSILTEILAAARMTTPC
jgi:hypothetical protein